MRFICAVMTCLIILWPLPGGTGEVVPGPIPAHVLAVLDGDTLLVDAQIWPGQRVATKVRVLGVDSPEMKGRCPEESRRAGEAKAFVENWIANREVLLEGVRFGKYAGRVLAVVKSGAGDTLSEALLAQGLARPYDGGKRRSWCG